MVSWGPFQTEIPSSGSQHSKGTEVMLSQISSSGFLEWIPLGRNLRTPNCPPPPNSSILGFPALGRGSSRWPPGNPSKLFLWFFRSFATNRFHFPHRLPQRPLLQKKMHHFTNDRNVVFPSPVGPERQGNRVTPSCPSSHRSLRKGLIICPVNYQVFLLCPRQLYEGVS